MRQMVDAISRIPDWGKYLLAALLTSTIWVGFGEIHADSANTIKRLDSIETRVEVGGSRLGLLADRLTSVANDALLLNTRQSEQITNMERRMVELERGRELNRENIGNLLSKQAAFETRIAELDRTIADMRNEIRRGHVLSPP